VNYIVDDYTDIYTGRIITKNMFLPGALWRYDDLLYHHLMMIISFKLETEPRYHYHAFNIDDRYEINCMLWGGDKISNNISYSIENQRWVNLDSCWFVRAGWEFVQNTDDSEQTLKFI